MEQAIKLAIEKGGYKLGGRDKEDSLRYSQYLGWEEEMTYDEIILDPLFWQALGKALRWDEGDLIDPTYAAQGDPNLSMWQHQARKYFDLVLTGGNTEKFWKELITP